jgi:hypothetical protein
MKSVRVGRAGAQPSNLIPILIPAVASMHGLAYLLQCLIPCPIIYRSLGLHWPRLSYVAATNERTNSAWYAYRRKKRKGKRGLEEKSNMKKQRHKAHGWKREIKSESERKSKIIAMYHARGRGGPRVPRRHQQWRWRRQRSARA